MQPSDYAALWMEEKAHKQEYNSKRIVDRYGNVILLGTNDPELNALAKKDGSNAEKWFHFQAESQIFKCKGYSCSRGSVETFSL